MKNDHPKLKSAFRLIIGLVIFIAFVEFFGDIRNIRSLVALRLDLGLAVLVLTFFINAIAAYRMNAITIRFFEVGGYRRLLEAILIGRVAGHTTSQVVGDLGSRFVYLRSSGVASGQAALAILFDKLLEGALFALVLLSFIISVSIPRSSFFLLTPAGLIGLSIALFAIAVFLLPEMALLTKRFSSREHPLVLLAAKFNSSFSSVLIASTVMKFSVSALRFWVLLLMAGIDLSIPKTILGTSAAQLGLAVGLTPGGLGLVEAGWAGALKLYEISDTLIARFLVTQRLLIFASVLVLLALFFLIKTLRERKSHQRT